VPRQINATIRDRLRYGPRSDYQPDLLWDLDLYARLARADAWAFIGPINWYGPSSNFKLLFDRLVCMNEWRESLTRSMRKKNTASAQALERSARWEGLSKNHLEGRSAAFFCYGDRGGADLDAEGRPKILAHKEWFDPKDEPYDNERNAYQSLVWQYGTMASRCRTRSGLTLRLGLENYTLTAKPTA
jgi:hypothetical protein